MIIYEQPAEGAAWDCDPFFIAEPLATHYDLDEENADQDWQVICLARFGDRLVNGELR